jgi:ribosomal protein S15P/S13E
MPKKVKTEKKEEAKAEKKTEKLSQEQFEKKVIELSNKGLTAEKIGEALKRQGIHSKEYNKKISQILGSKYKNPDQENISLKLTKLEEHVKNNHGDKRAIREKGRIFAQLKRLKEYLNK